jgi:radical SAM superfamily enzyme YgiQ (UPF0313 family)
MAFPWVLERFARGEPLVSTPEYRCEPVNGGVCVSPVTRIKQLDITGVPVRQRFDMDTYYQRGGALNIQTKRGCPLTCSYCVYPMVEGRVTRLRSPADVLDEIERVQARLRPRGFEFVDSTFAPHSTQRRYTANPAPPSAGALDRDGHQPVGAQAAVAPAGPASTR